MEAVNTINQLGSVGAVAKPKPKLVTRLLKYFLYSVLSLALLLTGASWVWKMSGSNEWKLVMDQDGIQVYSMKVPGSSLLKFKGVAHYDYSLNQLVATMAADENELICREYMFGCVSYDRIEPFDTQRLTDLNLWRVQMPLVFKPREFLMKGQIYQDGQTKELFVEFTAVPNRVSYNDCCVRVIQLHNTWRYTPLETGGIRVEHIHDMDMGGFFPAFLKNIAAANGVHSYLLHEIPKMMKIEKFQNAQFDFIDDYK